tara:strand:- start:231 stop:512 length:282 start_codon:yes stop_codon:yes gene_type:complete
MALINYELTIWNSLAGGSDYWATQAAADSIEMKYSEYFKWEGDAQVALSKSNAIKYAEEEMQKYPPNVRKYLHWCIYNEESREHQSKYQEGDE